MNDIWYLREEGDLWIKLKQRSDLGILEDFFEIIEDCPQNNLFIGSLINMNYGTMQIMIDRGDLLSEDNYLNKSKDEN